MNIPTRTYKKLVWHIKREANYRFFRLFRYKRVVRRHLQCHYTADAPAACNEQKLVVAMCDGRRQHGGLADRLRGFTSLYIYCRDHGLDFRIHFVSPFRLEKYLEPNHYNWHIDDQELSYNAADAHAVYMDTARSEFCNREIAFQRHVIDKFLSLPFKQIHAYSNLYCEEEHFSELFHHLFRPTAPLQRLVDDHAASLGEGYISISTRFLELLGDFNEHRDRPAQGLPEAEQEQLIRGCLEQITRIHEQHPDVPSVLITSDSVRFLERAAQLDFVRVLPGEVGHMDVVGGGCDELHTKTFVDFLLIARAAEVYLLVTGPMYRSNFSFRASQLGQRPFHTIEF